MSENEGYPPKKCIYCNADMVAKSHVFNSPVYACGSVDVTQSTRSASCKLTEHWYIRSELLAREVESLKNQIISLKAEKLTGQIQQ